MKYVSELLKEIKNALIIAWKSSRLIFLFSVLFECYQLVSPIVIAYMFKLATNEIVDLTKADVSDFSRFIRIITMMLVLQIISVAVSMIVEDLKEQHTSKMNYYVNLTLLRHINKLDIAYFDNSHYYNMIDKAFRDSVAVSKLSTISISLIRSLIQIIVCSIILGGLNIIIPGILILFLIPFAIAQIRFLRLKIQFRDEKIENDRHLQQTLFVLKDKKYAKDLRIYHTQDHFFERYNYHWEKGYNEQKVLVRKKIKMFSITKVIPHFLTFGVLIFLVYCILQGKATIGDFSYFKGITSQFIGACNLLITSFVQSRDLLAQMKNYNEFLDTEPSVKYDGGKTISEIESIEFVNVCFKYPGTKKEVLKNINVKLYGKKIYSLVGKNGAGKSTFVKLLLRLYDPTEGVILINGINLRDIDINSYHERLGVMFQDYNTYLLPVRDNIAMSDLKNVNDDNRIYNACENAEFDCNSSKYTKGLDTYIGKLFDNDGVLLSGGESQRISIARTYFNLRTQFFVMDEPNSSLDPEAESHIFDKLVKLSEGRGVLFITHRMSTTAIADEILVFDRGELVERGTHDNLMSNKNVYYQLYSLQADKFKNS